MAIQNSFLCECGRVIGRMMVHEAYLPWNAPEGTPVHTGIQCGQCGQNFTWVKPKDGAYVNVKKCCTSFMCDSEDGCKS